MTQEPSQAQANILDVGASSEQLGLNKPDSPRFIKPGTETQTSNTHRKFRVFQRVQPWIPEAAWCLLAIALLISLAIVLSRFDNQALPEWPLGLTLNTVAALLATICRSMIVIPITEGISQLKWNWFVTSEQALQDIFF